MVTNLVFHFKVHNWCLPAHTNFSSGEDLLSLMPVGHSLFCSLVFFLSDAKTSKTMFILELHRLKIQLFSVFCWRTSGSPKGKVGEPFCLNNLMCSGSKHHKWLRRYEQNSISEQLLKNGKTCWSLVVCWIHRDFLEGIILPSLL